jgi:pSer/pThr/pTyr-binding forkhead associated (FHA) protein
LPGLRASDAERDEIVTQLRDEYVSGRLSHDTFMYRVNLVMQSRRQADLPPFVADLPSGPGGPVVPGYLVVPGYPVVPGQAQASGGLAGWLREAWARVTGTAGLDDSADPRALPLEARAFEARAHARRPMRRVTSGMALLVGRPEPFTLQFPRAAGERFTIGRDASCDLAIEDMSVSRQHAQLERTPDGWLLSDLESTNGTRVNGWRVRGQVPVKVGDLVTFGSIEVLLVSSSEPGTLTAIVSSTSGTCKHVH